MLPAAGVISIATGAYLEHWSRQVRSVDEFLFPGARVAVTLFTDRPSEAVAVGAGLERCDLHVVEIASLGWPDATAQRYRIFTDNWTSIQGDMILYLDADMLVVSPTGDELNPNAWTGGIALVQHPGYYRGDSPWRLRLQHSGLFVSDAKRLLDGERAIGQWERDPRSQAYVSHDKRGRYVCGGAWMGRRPELQRMISTLADRTDTDSSNGIVARWHDESHLNWWASAHAHTTLPPEYCYDPGAGHLSGITARIVAVDKNG